MHFSFCFLFFFLKAAESMTNYSDVNIVREPLSGGL